MLTHTSMRYDSSNYRRHKDPGGWGSICPHITQEEAQQLLNDSVEAGRSRYNVCGEQCFQANCDNTVESVWHGFPIPWSELPAEAKNKLIDKGVLTNTFYRKAIRKSLGSEFAP